MNPFQLTKQTSKELDITNAKQCVLDNRNNNKQVNISNQDLGLVEDVLNMLFLTSYK